MWKSNVVLVSLLVSTIGCAGDDGSDSEGDDAADTEAVASTGDAPSSTTGGGSESSTTDLLPGSESSGSDEPGDTLINATLSGGESSSGGEPTDCAALDATACEEAPDCEPITASAIVEDPEDPEAWCVEEATVVGCRGADDRCDALLTHACDPDDNVYEVGSDCLPRGWSTCDPPTLGAPDCPVQDEEV